MGTNYYSVKKCKHCGHEDSLHIGKSSVGWLFMLHIHPERGIIDLASWRPVLEDKGRSIVNEYGRDVPFDEMWATIATPPERAPQSRLCEMGPDAAFGPIGYFRHRIDGRFCIAHGDFWDITEHEFS